MKRGGEGAALGGVRHQGVEFLELVDEQQDVALGLAGAGAQLGAQEAGLGAQAGQELLVVGDLRLHVRLHVRARQRGQLLHDAGQRRQRAAPRPQGDHAPGLARGLERRADAGADERRLADAGGTDHAGERVLADARGHAGDVAGAAEEAIGVALLERGQAGVGALLLAQLAAAPAGQQHLERAHQLGGAGDALLLALAQAAVDHPGQHLGDVGGDRAQRRHRVVERGGVGDQRGRGQRLQRVAPGQHLEHHDADRPQIGAVVDGVHAELLGGHVRHGADHGPLLGEAHVGQGHVIHLRRRPFGLPLAQRLGDAEVEHLHHAGAGDEDVLRLEVAVDDVELLGAGQRAGDRQHQVDGA
jgi:hypothetical protein